MNRCQTINLLIKSCWQLQSYKIAHALTNLLEVVDSGRLHNEIQVDYIMTTIVFRVEIVTLENISKE